MCLHRYRSGYYRCNARSEHGKCANRSFQFHQVEDAVMQAILDLVADPARMLKAAQNRSRAERDSHEKALKVWRKKLDEAHAQIERLTDLVAMGGAVATTVRSKLADANATALQAGEMVEHYQGRLASTDPRSFEAMALEAQKRIAQGLTDEVKRELVRRLVVRVTLEPTRAKVQVRAAAQPALMGTPMKRRAQYKRPNLAENVAPALRPQPAEAIFELAVDLKPGPDARRHLVKA
jgi:hypothetical protein